MKSSELYSLAFDTIADPLVLVDERGSVLLCNGAAATLLDFGPERSMAATRCRHADAEFNSAEIVETMRRHESVRDYQLLSAAGGETGITLDTDAVRDPAGRPVACLMHFRDESRSRREEIWRDEMIAMVSHELKNPLSAMKNSVEILLSQDPGELNDGQLRFLATSERSIDRLTHLVDGFLDVSRVTSGAFELNRRKTDVRAYLRDVIRSFSALYNVQRVDLTWDVADDVNRAYIDGSKLDHVLVNLLSNALKFTPAGGAIELMACAAGVEKFPDDLRLLPWKALGRPRLLEVSVMDNGLGMSSETLENVFNRFHGGRKPPGQGSHLGLNISRTLVEAQDGWLDIVSQLGLGTKVTVYVPSDSHTTCVVSRVRRLQRVVERELSAHRSVAVLAIAKTSADNWDDVSSEWARPPAVNPAPFEPSGDWQVWTLDGEIAVGVSTGRGEIAELLGPAFVECGDDAYVFGPCAVGICEAPGQARTLAQLCNVAVARMGSARDVLLESRIDSAASRIESVVNELGG